jgi:hypothetical protein
MEILMTFKNPLTVASTRDTTDMLQQCPMQHGGVVLSVLRMKEHNRTYRTTEVLHSVLTSVVITFYLLLFTILELYCMIRKIKRYPCYRPWRPLGLREVEAPTFLRQTANRWRQGCQPYAPAALYPPGFLFKFTGTHFC